MNLKEAFEVLSDVARNTFTDAATLVLNEDGFSFAHVNDSPTINLWDEIHKNGLTVETLKPVAKVVFECYINRLSDIHSDVDDDDIEIANAAKENIKLDTEYMRKLLAELLQ